MIFSMRNLRKLLLGAALCASMAATGAHATVVLSDNFDSENGGASALNYAGFANWTVTGQVDLVRQPDYGIACNSGSCVDLDGTSGPGRITTANSYHFNAGDTVTLNFDVSGNQRGGSPDDFYTGFTFVNPVQLNNVMFFGGNYGNLGSSTGLTGTFFGMPSSYPWTSTSFSFVAGNAGDLHAFFGTPSADNIGPLVDNIGLSISAGAPEPAAWALMIGGFGLAGAALRRRRTLALA